MLDSVEGTRERFIDAARQTALVMPTPRTIVESAETEWERRNPAGYGEVVEDHTRVTLWNFAVGSVQLKQGHRWALRTAMSSWIGEDVAVTVTGSASRSGSEATNLNLGRGRAEAAAAELATMSIPVRLVRTAGEREASTSDEPSQMARDRSVVVSVERLAPLEADPTQEALPGPPTPSAPLQPNQQLTVEISEDTFPIPTNYVLVTVTLKGYFTAVVGDPKGRPGDWTIKYTLKSTEDIPRVSAAAIEKQLNEDWKASAKVGFNASGQLEVQLKGTRRLPLNWSTGGGVGLTGPFVQVAWEGPHTVTALDIPVTGKLKLEGTVTFTPTPALMQLLVRLGIYARSAATAAGEAATEAAIAAARATGAALSALASRAAAAAAVAAPVVGYALTGATGAVLFAGAYQRMLDEQVRQAADRSFQITARLAYTTVVARAVLGGSADADFRAAVNQLEEIGRSRPDAMEHAEQAVALALTDLLNLGGELDVTLQALGTRFAVAADGTPDTQFKTARERMFLALGGLADSPAPIGLPSLLAVEAPSPPGPTKESAP